MSHLDGLPLEVGDFTPYEEKRIWDMAEKAYPELWRKCYPRIYEDYKPNLYYTPKAVARQMFGSIQKINIGAVGQSEQMELLWASMLASKRVPQYWVSPDILEAIMQTTPPLELDWYNMHLPQPAMAFMLPKGAIVHPVEGDVRFVSFNRSREGEWYTNIADEQAREIGAGNGSFCVFAGTRGYFTHWNMPHYAYPTVNLKEIDEALRRHEDREHSTGWWLSQAKMTHEDTTVGIKCAHLLFGLLLLMTRKPELVSGGELLRSIPPKKGEMRKEFWSPPVIGRDYKIKRVAHRLGGTHASPRYHWVSGYWKEQPYGPGRASVKEIWVEPYERGLDEE